HVTGEDLAFCINLAAAANFNNLLGRHDNVLDLVRKPLLVCLIQNRLSYLLLEIGIGVDNVPTHCHKKCLPSPSDSDADSKNQIDDPRHRSEEHTSELQSRENLVCRLLLEKKKKKKKKEE